MEQYISLLKGVLQYEQRQFQIVSVILMISLAMIAVGIFSRRKKQSVSDKVTLALIVATLCVVYACYGVSSANYQKAVLTDISEGTFETYIGDYTHDDYQKDSFYHNVYISNEAGEDTLLRYPDYGNHYRLRDDFAELPIGTYSGKLVYAKHSKILLDWTIED